MLPYFVATMLLLFQCWVTWRVWREEFFVRSEKVAQTKLVWLLPLLGAIFVYVMLVDEAKHNGY